MLPPIRRQNYVSLFSPCSSLLCLAMSCFVMPPHCLGVSSCRQVYVNSRDAPECYRIVYENRFKLYTHLQKIAPGGHHLWSSLSTPSFPLTHHLHPPTLMGVRAPHREECQSALTAAPNLPLLTFYCVFFKHAIYLKNVPHFEKCCVHLFWSSCVWCVWRERDNLGTSLVGMWRWASSHHAGSFMDHPCC